MDHRDIELDELRRRVGALEGELRVVRPMMLELQAHVDDLERQIQVLKRPSERPTRPPPPERNVLGVRGKLPPR